MQYDYFKTKNFEYIGMKIWLDAISLFNINARYDDYKREFYNQCTKDFAKLWIERIKEIRKWIKEKL